MAQGRSLFKEILRDFVNSLSPRHFKQKWVGKDYFGTEYYEAPLSPHKKRPSRWFAPAKTDSDSFQQEIPPEWDAWLRHKRKDPPTEEEIQLNLARMRQTVENAKKLEKPQTVSKDEVKSLEKAPFPKYEDYNFGPIAEEKRKL